MPTDPADDSQPPIVASSPSSDRSTESANLALRLETLRAAGVGFAAGLLNGLLGIGGGIVIVPGLILLRNLNAHGAVVTSLGTVLCLSSVALVVHLALSGLYFGLLDSLIVLVAGAVGSQLGAVLLRRLSQRWVLYLFGGFTFVASTHLILTGLGVYGSPVGLAAMPPRHSLALIAGLAGVASGVLGLGGGGMVVLGLSVAYNTPILGAIPLALAINIGNSTSGLFAQRGRGLVRWDLVVRLVPAALAGIGVGVGLALVLPAPTLKVLFALFFVYMGTRLIARGRRS